MYQLGLKTHLTCHTKIMYNVFNLTLKFLFYEPMYDCILINFCDRGWDKWHHRYSSEVCTCKKCWFLVSCSREIVLHLNLLLWWKPKMRTHLLASVGLCIPLHSFIFFLFLFQLLNFTGFRKILKKHDKV